MLAAACRVPERVHEPREYPELKIASRSLELRLVDQRPSSNDPTARELLLPPDFEAKARARLAAQLSGAGPELRVVVSLAQLDALEIVDARGEMTRLVCRFEIEIGSGSGPVLRRAETQSNADLPRDEATTTNYYVNENEFGRVQVDAPWSPPLARVPSLRHPRMTLEAPMTQSPFDPARYRWRKVTVPDAGNFARFAVMWEPPADLELRVTDGDKVLVGSSTPTGETQQVIALGSTTVPSPVLARVYSVPGATLGQADITAELRITAESCGRTLRVETVHSVQGLAVADERSVSVPLCGTAGDILVLKNLAPALTLAAPK